MNDGWNKEKLEGVISVLEDIYSLQYEIQNCVRGCYTGARTYEELKNYINSLADQLHNEAEDLDLVKDEEEDEGYEDPDFN